MLKNQRGFTLLSLVVFMGFFSVVSVSAMTLAIQGLKVVSNTQPLGTATTIAFNKWSQLLSSPYANVVSEPRTALGDDYDREVTVTEETLADLSKQKNVKISIYKTGGNSVYSLNEIKTQSSGDDPSTPKGVSKNGTQIFTESGNFVVPENVIAVKATVIGGAGGGGGRTSSINGGSGATGWLFSRIIAVTPGQVVPVTIGQGGNGGTDYQHISRTRNIYATVGSVGGTSSFGSYLSAPGGGGGIMSCPTSDTCYDGSAASAGGYFRYGMYYDYSIGGSANGGKGTNGAVIVEW